MGTIIKQKNNHARSKQRRKALRAKNFWKRVMDGRSKKLARLSAPKGKTLPKDVKAKDLATDLSIHFPKARLTVDGKLGPRLGYQGLGYLFDHDHGRRLNQKQKRKKWASNPHLRNK